MTTAIIPFTAPQQRAGQFRPPARTGPSYGGSSIACASPMALTSAVYRPATRAQSAAQGVPP
jgi:hypothetical protein